MPRENRFDARTTRRAGAHAGPRGPRGSAAKLRNCAQVSRVGTYGAAPISDMLKLCAQRSDDREVSYYEY